MMMIKISSAASFFNVHLAPISTLHSNWLDLVATKPSSLQQFATTCNIMLFTLMISAWCCCKWCLTATSNEMIYISFGCRWPANTCSRCCCCCWRYRLTLRPSSSISVARRRGCHCCLLINWAKHETTSVMHVCPSSIGTNSIKSCSCCVRVSLSLMIHLHTAVWCWSGRSLSSRPRSLLCLGFDPLDETLLRIHCCSLARQPQLASQL